MLKHQHTQEEHSVHTLFYIHSSLSHNRWCIHTQFFVNWGDGRRHWSVTGFWNNISDSLTHTLHSWHIHSKRQCFNNGHRIYWVTNDFTAYPTSPATSVILTTAQNIVSVLWDFGDGTTSTAENPEYTWYSLIQLYTVTLTGYTSGGDAVEVTKSDYILASPQTLLDKSSYEAGETATITWQLREPDFTNYQYTLQILASDSQGNTAGTSIITPVVIDSASSLYTMEHSRSIQAYYTAAIFRSGTASPIVFCHNKYHQLRPLTVNLAINGVTYTTTQTTVLQSVRME